MTKWIQTDKGYRRDVPGLGLFEVYKEPRGVTITINDRIAWSCWKGKIEDRLADMNRQIREWEYLNSFRT